MNLYLGIDGGGTRTVLVPDSGKVLQVGKTACPRARLQDPVGDATDGAALNALSFAKKTSHPDFPNK